jgi:tripeptidyl-peptidase-1
MFAHYLIIHSHSSVSFLQAFPDVSAQSTNFAVILQGNPVLIGGTSAAAPTFAGIVALLNDALIAAGKSPLGFLNPMLYSTGLPGLRDITQGNAPGCGTQGFNVRSVSFFRFKMYLVLNVCNLGCD